MIISHEGIGFNCYDFTDKDRLVNDLCQYMLSRTQSMFEYNNLPSTIPAKFLELYAQYYGIVCIYHHEGNLYASFGGWGGVPNEYYQPTKFIVTNPYLELSKTFTIDEDCVLLFNDSMYMGLKPMFERYATLLVENELSMYMADINARFQTLLSADDDSTKASAELFIRRLVDGKLSVIANSSFLDSLQVHNTSSTGNGNSLTNLIEFEQYLKASLFNELGLNANYNMKRESINSNEAQLNDDMLLPLIDDMLKCRKDAVEKINNMFGTNISVDFASAWKDNIEELELNQEILESQTETDKPRETEDAEDDNREDNIE